MMKRRMTVIVFHRSNHPLRVLELLVATSEVVILCGTRRIYAGTWRQAFALRLLIVSVEH